MTRHQSRQCERKTITKVKLLNETVLLFSTMTATRLRWISKWTDNSRWTRELDTSMSRRPVETRSKDVVVILWSPPTSVDRSFWTSFMLRAWLLFPDTSPDDAVTFDHRLPMSMDPRERERRCLALTEFQQSGHFRRLWIFHCELVTLSFHRYSEAWCNFARIQDILSFNLTNPDDSRPNPGFDQDRPKIQWWRAGRRDEK